MIYTWRWKADRSICLSIRRGDALQEQNTIVHPLAIFDSYQKIIYITRHESATHLFTCKFEYECCPGFGLFPSRGILVLLGLFGSLFS